MRASDHSCIPGARPTVATIAGVASNPHHLDSPALARTQTLYVCRTCGGEAVKWQGQCAHCKEWDSLEAVTAVRGVRQLPGTSAAVSSLDDLPEQADSPERRSFGL